MIVAIAEENMRGVTEMIRDVAARARPGRSAPCWPTYLLQLALLGPAAVDGVPDAVRALWPA